MGGDMVKLPARIKRVFVSEDDASDTFRPPRLRDDLEAVLQALRHGGREYELVFVFYVAPGNFDQCLVVLDLCQQFDGMPEFLLWPDDCSQQIVLRGSDAKQFDAVLDRLDKELWARGWPRAALAPALAQLSRVVEKRDLMKLSRPQLVYSDGSEESVEALFRGVARFAESGWSLRIGIAEPTGDSAGISSLLVRAGSLQVPVRTFGPAGERINPPGNETEFLAPDGGGESAVRAAIAETRTRLALRASGQKNLTFQAGSGLRTFWRAISEGFTGAEVDHCSLAIPFW